MKDNSPIKIEISHRTIIFTLLIIIFGYLIFLIRDVLTLLFIAFMVSVAMSPLVHKLKQLKIPENISIALAYLFITATLAGVVAGVVPPFINESAKLIAQIPIPPSIASDIKNLNIDLQDLNAISSQLNSIPKVFSFIGSAVAMIVITITIGVMSFYILKERKNLHKNLIWLFGNNQTEKKAEAFVARIETQIGGWVRGEFILMVAVGLLTFLGLKLLNINFAIPLALIAGLLEVLPNIGPTIAAIPAIAIALTTTSPTMALAVTALYILIQQLENSFIVPIVMKKTVGINPVTTIMLILIGFRLGKVGGAALAIPLFLTTKVIFQEYLKVKKA